MSGSLTDVGYGPNNLDPNRPDSCCNWPYRNNNSDPNDYSDLTDPDSVREVMLIAGFSAYQIAVANGFVGTEAEWLESLKASSDGGPLSGNGNAVTFQAAGSSVERTLQSKLSDILSVLDFGADNSGQLDCSLLFGEVAAAAASGSGAGLVYINPGNYTLLSPVEGSPDLTWIVNGNILGGEISYLPGNYIQFGNDGSLLVSHPNIRLTGVEEYDGENPSYEDGSGRVYSSGGVLKIWQ